LSDPTVPHPEDLRTVNTVVHDLVNAFDLSIAAEHGIGHLRRDELVRYKSSVELSMMKDIKRPFDPQNIMKTRKVVDVDEI
jgi:FAD/FMN-containing dehydrogenase